MSNMTKGFRKWCEISNNMEAEEERSFEIDKEGITE